MEQEQTFLIQTTQWLAGREKALSALLRNERLQQQIALSAQVVAGCLAEGGKVLTAGNGGSASQAMHLASELMGKMCQRRRAMSALALSADPTVLTCIGNDYGYERVFARQVEGVGRRGDVFVGFTTSGRSRNLLEALACCRRKGIATIMLTGHITESLQALADVVVETPATDGPMAQEVQMVAVHALCAVLEQHMVQASEADSMWQQLLALNVEGFRYLMLDRDGVVNRVKANGYIADYGEFEFMPGFLDSIARVSDAYDRVFILTNQKGVGKGMMTGEQLEAVHRSMEADIVKAGGRIDAIYTCTAACGSDPMMKPQVGMALLAQQEFPEVDFNRTVVVGDSYSDQLMAMKIGARFIWQTD